MVKDAAKGSTINNMAFKNIVELHVILSCAILLDDDMVLDTTTVEAKN
jgi:hypothetical protein